MAEIPLFERQRQDEAGRNGLESVETEIHRVPCSTTPFIATKSFKQDPDGLNNDVLPHIQTESSMINTCMIISDSSTSDTPEERRESRPQTPTGALITLFTSEMNTDASDDKENERNGLESHSADGVEMESTMTQRFTTPELSQINGFR